MSAVRLGPVMRDTRCVALAGRGGIAAAPDQRDPVLLEGARNRVGVEHDAVTDGGGANAEFASERDDARLRVVGGEHAEEMAAQRFELARELGDELRAA